MMLPTEKRDVHDQLIHHFIGIGLSYLTPGDVAVEEGPTGGRKDQTGLAYATLKSVSCHSERSEESL